MNAIIQQADAFLDVCRQYDTIYIYGASPRCFSLASFLEYAEIRVSGFVVSAKRPDNQNSEYPIHHIGDIVCSKSTGIVLGLSSRYYNEVFALLNSMNIDGNAIFVSEELKEASFQKFTPQPASSTVIEVNLTDHCNLRCQMCDHFSPLAKEFFLDIDIFERDIKRLAEISNRGLLALQLMGGEPLLHPRVDAFAVIARKYLPTTEINFFTNGLLLLDPGMEKFYKACRENNCCIKLTPYPIKLNLLRIKNKAKSECVKLEIFNSSAGLEIPDIKNSYKAKMDRAGGQKPYRVIDCYQMNRCNVLKDGKLYPCPTVGHIEILNEYFGLSFKVGAHDYIDIHGAQGWQAISQFLASPHRFCRYCDIGGRCSVPWERTRYVVDEWV